MVIVREAIGETYGGNSRYQNQLYNTYPWLIIKDFNIILDSQGKTGRKKVDKNDINKFTNG